MSINAEPGERATLLLGATVNIPLEASHPDFNPVMRAMNNRMFEFFMDAIPVVVIN